ncbi:DnaA ATPase domain-containing protein [Moraxella atlantae]|uniref:DnaA-homolog protein hda n=1 Tax=Faucicola atlantae TaxID=34059 RepID=A0A378Q483_9GAMM|nr:DnaA/Hda family protein [Moraxella atlantae]OPH35108.1 DnaA regulatory inactivator Hda [Moraxella atlantae]STY94998.1 DnaA-homolog protein hda [Moraxella atlantae]
MTQRQLSLDLYIKQDASLSDFAGPGWLTVIDAVRQAHVGLVNQLYLQGEADTGKSHLLAAIGESFRELGSSVIYLSMRELVGLDPQVVGGLEHMDMIAIDDIDAIEGHAGWQEAIFHLINRSRERSQDAQVLLAFASRKPFGQLDFGLQDLKSRLAKSLLVALPTGSDRSDRALILQAVLKRRNWQFDPRITDYLLDEGPKRIGAMLEVLTAVQPMFTNLERAHVTKAKVQAAIKLIDERTLLDELRDLTSDDDTLASDRQQDWLDF